MAQTASPLSPLVARRALDLAGERLAEEPVIALQGPRTVGKSTLLGELARRHSVEVIDLDDPATRQAVDIDPGLFLEGMPPVCIDEYQHVPEVLDAIKAELNRNLRPGRFVIAGSTRYDALPRAAQSLAGRLHLMTIWPLSQSELAGSQRSLLDTLISDPKNVPRGKVSSTTREQYVARITTGGMPIALSRSTAASRNRWFDDYLQLVIERDISELSSLRRREQLPALFAQLAAQTARVLNLTAVASRAGLDRATASEYVKLLEAVFLIVRLPAWGTTLRARSTRAAKLHVVDSGVAARVLRLAPEKLAHHDPAALSQLGHLLETFTVGELLRQCSWLPEISICGHWRTSDGDEVDLVIERDDGQVIAFEIKAAGRVQQSDARGLRKLGDALGNRLLAGILLHTGPYAHRLEDRIHAIPIDQLWAQL